MRADKRTCLLIHIHHTRVIVHSGSKLVRKTMLQLRMFDIQEQISKHVAKQEESKRRHEKQVYAKLPMS